MEHYRLFYSPQQDEANSPKTPANALDALASYADRIKLIEREVLYTEVAGTAPLAEDCDVAFKIDAIVRDADGIWVVDHKTGSRLTAAWTEGWANNMQLCIYVHVLNYFFGQENVAGARVEGTIFHKHDHQHIEVPVRKTKESFGALFWSIVHNVDLIKHNIKCEEAASVDDEILTAWPMNPGSCFDFGHKCIYHDYCLTYCNPLGHQCPMGFTVKEWNPLEVLEDHNKLEKVV